MVEPDDLELIAQETLCARMPTRAMRPIGKARSAGSGAMLARNIASDRGSLPPPRRDRLEE